MLVLFRSGGQGSVTTWEKGEDGEAGVWQRVREEVAEGRQAYVVCPLIGESEKLEVASAEETFERLEADELSGLSLGLLHGRLPADAKDAALTASREGRSDERRVGKGGGGPGRYGWGPGKT